ncbi:MAG: TIGR00159 family protein [Bryobacterales bacterium]|nr:TIGR00159 family protein [Bryobacterales bacterium]
MRTLWDQFVANLPPLTVAAVLDILIVAVLIYQAAMIIRGRRAAHVLAGVGIVLVAYALAVWLGLDLLRGILERLLPYSAFALIVLFQSEIRRFLARIGRRRWIGFGSRLENQEALQDILIAVQQLASVHTGALIVVERDIGLRTFIESGVPMDAELTVQLLVAIFQPGNPLHDGAVIIQGNRIAAASCFLPITTNPELSRRLGTRHRAAIGITEESDCVAVVVSEETGRVSIARGGEIESDVTLGRLSEVMGTAAPASGATGRSLKEVREEQAAREP